MNKQTADIYNGTMRKCKALLNDRTPRSQNIALEKQYYNTLQRLRSDLGSPGDKQYLSSVIYMQSILSEYAQNLDNFISMNNRISRKVTDAAFPEARV